MSSLPAAELQLQQAANLISPQSAGRDAVLGSSTSVMSESAEGTAGQIEPALLNVDAEMANSQAESLVQVASKAAWGFETNAKGEIVAQENPLIYKFDEDTPEFQADLRKEMPWFDSNWSIMTIIFRLIFLFKMHAPVCIQLLHCCQYIYQLSTMMLVNTCLFVFDLFCTMYPPTYHNKNKQFNSLHCHFLRSSSIMISYNGKKKPKCRDRI